MGVVIGPGTIIERYRVQRHLGTGAMGEVYLAIDESLGRRSALKILAEPHRDNAELRARFLREARAMAAIAHPNVVQVFTTGEFDGRPYLAMEYLSGRDLGSLVKESGPLDSASAAAAVRDASRGLDAAARAGLIHRDVKPSNLILGGGAVKLTDFGLAKPVLPDVPAPITAMGFVVGTPDYIAPEQARGDDIDWRVDVYALGATLFYLLTGRPPFRTGIAEEDKLMRVVTRHLKDPPPDACVLNGQADPELAALGRRMMAKAPAARPSHADVEARAEAIRARLVEKANPSATTAPLGPRRKAAPAGGEAVRPADDPIPVASADVLPAVDDAPLVPTRRPRLAGWLVGVTVVSAVTFLSGLGLLLFGPKGRAAATPAPDATAVAARTPDAAPVARPALTPPPGMVLVTRADGTPLVFVDAAPVTNREYAEVVRTHHFARRDADRPAAGVAFDYAVAYARARGKRLVRTSEWPSAATQAGFASSTTLWEWVDDGVPVGTAGDRPVRRGASEEGRRPASGRSDTTFRLALDLPGA